VTVLVGERNVEPEIMSWRILGEEGITRGSMVEFAKTVLYAPTVGNGDNLDGQPVNGTETESSKSSIGLIVANPFQLIWYRGGSRAVSSTEWVALPRPSAVHEPPRIDSNRNRIPENRNHEEHVAYIFEKVIPSLVKKDAKLDIIGTEFPGKAVLDVLAANCESNLFSTS
jgi:hypothetical protein